MRTSIFLVAIGCGWLAATAQAASPDDELLKVLPRSDEAGLQIEAGLVVRDLRVYLDAMKRQRLLLAQSPAGKAYYDQGVQREQVGFDFITEVERLAKLAAPSGAPVPFLLVGYSSSQGPGAQLLLKAEPGFDERLAATMAGDSLPPWSARTTSEGLSFSMGDEVMRGCVSDGWLRLTLGTLTPTGGNVQALFEPALAAKLQASEAYLFVRGGGEISKFLINLWPEAQPFLAGTRALVIDWRHDADKTLAARLLLDAPLLQQVGPMVRPATLQSSIESLWGADATSFLSLSLPPALLGPGLQAMLANPEAQVVVTPALREVLGKLTGRVGLVSFGAPGDWAVALEAPDAKAATEVVPALTTWLTEMVQKVDATLAAKHLFRESFPGLPTEILHVRADVALEGVRVVNINQSVMVIAQRARVAKLQAMAAPSGKRPARLAGPVTPMMAAAIDTPALLTGYAVAGSDGGWMRFATWYATAIEALLIKEFAEKPETAWLARFCNRLPLSFAVSAFWMQLTYDMAFVADLDGTLLSLEFLTSEI